ncbi:hypothetical protein AAH678_05105 [Sodalis endosymbiont of Spalangia cameroni]|uniref:hypothetical protein n=1 Tax=Sodalis praecaptivus TaxID=1239307 RepID=UPI0031F9FBC3
MNLTDKNLAPQCATLINCNNYVRISDEDNKERKVLASKITEVNNKPLPAKENLRMKMALGGRNNVTSSDKRRGMSYKQINNVATVSNYKTNRAKHDAISRFDVEMTDGKSGSAIASPVTPLATTLFLARKFTVSQEDLDFNKLMRFVNEYSDSEGKKKTGNKCSEKTVRLKKVKADIKGSEILKKYIIIENDIIKPVHQEFKASRRDLFLVCNEFLKKHSPKYTFSTDLKALVAANYNLKESVMENYTISEDEAKKAAKLCRKWISDQSSQGDFSRSLRKLLDEKAMKGVLTEICSDGVEGQRKKHASVSSQDKALIDYPEAENQINDSLKNMLNLEYLDRAKKEYVFYMMDAINDSLIDISKECVSEKTGVKMRDEWSIWHRCDEKTIDNKITAMYDVIKKELVFSVLSNVFSSDDELIKNICKKFNAANVYDKKTFQAKMGKGLGEYGDEITGFSKLIDKVIDKINNRRDVLNGFNNELTFQTDLKSNELHNKIDTFTLEKINLVFNAAVNALKTNQIKHKTREIRGEIDKKKQEALDDSQKGKELITLINGYASELLQLKSSARHLQGIEKKYPLISEDLKPLTKILMSKEINDEVSELIDKAYQSVPKPNSKWHYMKLFYRKNRKELMVKVGASHAVGAAMQLIGKIFSSTPVKSVGYVAHGVGVFQMLKSIYDAWCFARKERHDLKEIHKEFASLKQQWQKIIS